jgi:CDP-glucose 4,6-dehydratase
VNQTVGELIDAMAARWPGMRAHVPEGREQAGHEATLLKLSCDKALFHLGWQAVLRFPETVALTIDWYRTWHGRQADLYDYTLGQIAQYCELARTRQLPWTRT